MPRKLICSSDAFLALPLLIFIAVTSGCSTKIGKNEFEAYPGTSKVILTPDTVLAKSIKVEQPPSTMDLLACIKCHQGLKINTQKRVLTGTHKDFVFDHPGFDTQTRWCYYCHSTKTYDALNLESGKLVPYPESYKLCVQCHVTKYADWEVGIHGRRTGEWNGNKDYQSCIFCHNPHSPKFKPIDPMKAPLKPAKFQKTDL